MAAAGSNHGVCPPSGTSAAAPVRTIRRRRSQTFHKKGGFREAIRLDRRDCRRGIFAVAFQHGGIFDKAQWVANLIGALIIPNTQSPGFLTVDHHFPASIPDPTDKLFTTADKNGAD